MLNTAIHFLRAIPILFQGEEPQLDDFARGGTARFRSRGLTRNAARTSAIRTQHYEGQQNNKSGSKVV
jgi:hypothetical protein